LLHGFRTLLLVLEENSPETLAENEDEDENEKPSLG
jgi:hypothetical protein